MQPYLIQRCLFKDKPEGLMDTLKDIIRYDYMGSSEFEFGAIPKAYRAIIGELPRSGIYPTGIRDQKKRELFVLCPEDSKEEALECVKRLATENYPYRLKEFCDMKSYLEGERCSNDLWWDITNNWIATTGKDRIMLVKKVLETRLKLCTNEFVGKDVWQFERDNTLYVKVYESRSEPEYCRCDETGKMIDPKIVQLPNFLMKKYEPVAKQAETKSMSLF